MGEEVNPYEAPRSSRPEVPEKKIYEYRPQRDLVRAVSGAFIVVRSILQRQEEKARRLGLAQEVSENRSC